VLTRVDTNGFVLEGWGYNNIHNAVRIMLYEGHDKYDQFVTQLEVIKQELREIYDGPGMELNGAIYIFKLVMVVIYVWHARASSTFFCFICDMARHNKHLTPADYQRKGMTPSMEKIAISAAVLAHAFGE
jgi:hypothetical protein